MQSISRSEAFFWCGNEPTNAQEQAAFTRSKIADIAELVESTAKRVVIGFPLTADPRLEELKNAIFVLRKLEAVLEAWPEFWSDEYLENTAGD